MYLIVHIGTKSGKEQSSEAYPSSGGPQGSLMRPLLFSIFVNDFFSVNRFCFTKLYADDSHSYHAAKIKDINQLQVEVNKDIKQVSKWMRENGMQLNIRKYKNTVIVP